VSTTPLVSVIVPAYNAERFLGEAVESVLRQTWHEIEVIIVDDGSSDGTAALAERLAASDPRVRVIHQENGGLSSARNAGLAASRGEYVSFLDADDVLLPDKIGKQLAFLTQFASCDLVYSDHYVGDSAATPTLLVSKRPPPLRAAELLVFRNWFAPFSPLLRAELARRVGGFDESLTASEDWDFWIRASRCGALSYLPGPVGVYRMHAEQMHRDLARLRANQDKVIRKNFPPGSPEWHITQAARGLAEATELWAGRSYTRMVRRLVDCLRHARSYRALKTLLTLYLRQERLLPDRISLGGDAQTAESSEHALVGTRRSVAGLLALCALGSLAGGAPPGAFADETYTIALGGVGWTGSRSFSTHPWTGPVTAGGPVVHIDDGKDHKTPEQRLTDALALLSTHDSVIIRNDSQAVVRLTRTIKRSAAWNVMKHVFAYGAQRIRLDGSAVPGGPALWFNRAAREHWKGFELEGCKASRHGAVVFIQESRFIKIEDFWLHHNPYPASQIQVLGGSDLVIQDCAMWHNGDGRLNDTNSGDGIGLSLGRTSPSRVQIVRCYIANSGDDGIDLWAASSAEIIDCAVVGAGRYWSGAVSGDGSGFKMGGETGVAGGNRISGSIAVDNLAAGVNANSAMGKTVVSQYTGYGNGHAFGNINVWTTSEVTQALSVQSPRTRGNVNSRQDSVNSNVVDAYNCWNLPFQPVRDLPCQDPRFADPAGGDFSLRPGSPYIGTGAGGATLGASTVALQLLKHNWARR
jgi:glycosyltransferase involved in cell wall biosynthesis